MSIENPFDEMRRAVEAARQVNRAVDLQAATLAELLAGRLRNVPLHRLAQLKRELRDFNIHTGKWKD